MFSCYEPPEELEAVFSQAAIVAADINADSRSVSAVVHSDVYVPQRLLDKAAKEITSLYGLSKVEFLATHPESELSKVEPEELMMLFVNLDSMTRGSLAGAKWEWQGTELHVKLRANGKAALEELVPQVQKTLRERFAAPVTIVIEAHANLEGKALFDAMASMRESMMENLPHVLAQQA